MIWAPRLGRGLVLTACLAAAALAQHDHGATVNRVLGSSAHNHGSRSKGKKSKTRCVEASKLCSLEAWVGGSKAFVWVGSGLAVGYRGLAVGWRGLAWVPSGLAVGWQWVDGA